MTETGSLCLNTGLQCHHTLTQHFFDFDNLLITGEHHEKCYQFVDCIVILFFVVL